MSATHGLLAMIIRERERGRKYSRRRVDESEKSWEK
jgi:hypothetical protein